MYKKQTINKRNLLVSCLGSTVFCLALILFVFPFKAQAGGREQPVPTPNSSSPKQPDEQLPTLSLLNWDRWGSPYWLSDKICRENQGNIICLSPELARQVRWEIPAQGESRNSN